MLNYRKERRYKCYIIIILYPTKTLTIVLTEFPFFLPTKHTHTHTLTPAVLNELDGLSRDAAVAKYGSVGHAVKVREGAAAALHYLRVTKPPSLKCVTSQGSVLSSTNFTDEIDVPVSVVICSSSNSCSCSVSSSGSSSPQMTSRLT